MKKSKLLELLGLEKIIETFQKLIEARIAIVKDEIEEKVAEKVAKILPLLLVVASFTLLILFGSLTLAFYLTDLMESYVYGFGLVALGYLLLTIIFYFLKDNKSLNKAFRDTVIKPSQNKDEEL